MNNFMGLGTSLIGLNQADLGWWRLTSIQVKFLPEGQKFFSVDFLVLRKYFSIFLI